MEDVGIKYTLLGAEESRNFSGNLVKWEGTYLAHHDALYSGEKFAKIVVNLCLENSNSSAGPNGVFEIRWFIIIDENEQPIEDGNLIWAHSDVFRIRPSYVKGDLKESIKKLIAKAFNSRLDLRISMQNQINGDAVEQKVLN